jgi:hypothetical protein
MKEQRKTLHQFALGGVRKWKHIAQAYYDLKEGNDCLLMKHEDVCADPIAGAKKIFDWMELEHHPEGLKEFADRYEPASHRREEDSTYQQYIDDDLIKLAGQVGFDLT